MDSRDSTRPQPTPSPFREAVFAGTANSPSDTLLVLIPDFGDQPFGDPDGVVWSPMGGALPQAGDRALVVESDDGSWWVVQWWSSNQSTGVAESDIRAHPADFSGSQSITAQTAGALAKLALNTIGSDPDGWWDSTNKRYIPQRAGRYLVTAGFVATVVGTGAVGVVDLAIAKNGTVSPPLGFVRVPMPPSAYGAQLAVSEQFTMNGTTDYLELFGGAVSAITGNETLRFVYLGA